MVSLLRRCRPRCAVRGMGVRAWRRRVARVISATPRVLGACWYKGGVAAPRRSPRTVRVRSVPTLHRRGSLGHTTASIPSIMVRRNGLRTELTSDEALVTRTGEPTAMRATWMVRRGGAVAARTAGDRGGRVRLRKAGVVQGLIDCRPRPSIELRNQGPPCTRATDGGRRWPASWRWCSRT